jgi:NADH-quinone oxidoreductase subunit A
MPFDFDPYVAIGVTILLVLVVIAGMLIVAHTLGPRRSGPVKDSPYESGMPILADTHRRFNIRFFVVAILFMLFDVEVIFLWPWATLFHQSATTGATISMEGGDPVGKGFLLAGMAVFFLLLLFGLIYEWKKGAFRWD